MDQPGEVDGAGRRGRVEEVGDGRRLAVAGRRRRRSSGRFEQVRGQQAVEVVAAEERVAADAQHLVIAEPPADDRHVEGAAAEVVDEIGRVAVVLDPGIIDGRRGRLVQQLDHLEAGQLAGLARGLDLVVVEVGRHRDDGRVEQVMRRRCRVRASMSRSRRRMHGRRLRRRAASRGRRRSACPGP